MSDVRYAAARRLIAHGTAFEDLPPTLQRAVFQQQRANLGADRADRARKHELAARAPATEPAKAAPPRPTAPALERDHFTRSPATTKATEARPPARASNDTRLAREARRRMVADGEKLEDLPPVYQRAFLAHRQESLGATRASRANHAYQGARQSVDANAARATLAAQVNEDVKARKQLLQAAKHSPSLLDRTLAHVTDATSYGLAEKTNDALDTAHRYYAERRASGHDGLIEKGGALLTGVADSAGINRVLDHRSTVEQTGDGMIATALTFGAGPLVGKGAQAFAASATGVRLKAQLAETWAGRQFAATGRLLNKPLSLPGRGAAGATESASSLGAAETTALAPQRQLVHAPPADRGVFRFGGEEVRLQGYVASESERAAFRTGHGAEFDMERIAATRARLPNAAALHDEEVAALLDYTGDAYRQTNKALWTNNPELMAREGNLIRMTSSGLSKMPKYEGLAYRKTALPESAAAEYQPGAVVTQRSFMSTSTSADATGVYQSGGAVKMEYTIASKTGRDVTTLSAHPSEREILFQPGTRFRVQAAERTAEGGSPYLRVHLVEL